MEGGKISDSNIVGWIQDAEANPVDVFVQHITYACVDTDHGGQSDICQTVNYTVVLIPNPHGHEKNIDERDVYLSKGVASCNQCPNPPFTNYN